MGDKRPVERTAAFGGVSISAFSRFTMPARPFKTVEIAGVSELRASPYSGGMARNVARNVARYWL